MRELTNQDLFVVDGGTRIISPNPLPVEIIIKVTEVVAKYIIKWLF